MSTELYYLTLTALLAACLWLPYIIGVSRLETADINTDFRRPRDLRTVPAWIHRAHRAHLNLLEQFLPFSILVLIAHSIDLSNTITIWTVALFFWVRLAHAIGMITGATLFPLRPIIFTTGWLCCLAMVWQVIANG